MAINLLIFDDRRHIQNKFSMLDRILNISPCQNKKIYLQLV